MISGSLYYYKKIADMKSFIFSWMVAVLRREYTETYPFEREKPAKTRSCGPGFLFWYFKLMSGTMLCVSMIYALKGLVFLTCDFWAEQRG